MRAILDKKFRAAKVQYTLTGMSSIAGRTTNSIFKIDTSIPEVEQLEATIQQAFAESAGKIQLATYSLERGAMRRMGPPSPPAAAAKPAAESPPPTAPEAKDAAATPAGEKAEASADGGAAPATTDAPAAPPADDAEKTSQPASGGTEPAVEKPAETSGPGAQRSLPSDRLLALAEEVQLALADTAASDAAPPVTAPDAAAPPQDAQPQPSPPAAAEPAATPAAEVAGKEDLSELSGAAPPAAELEAERGNGSPVRRWPSPRYPRSLIEVPLTFAYEINAETLRGEILDAAAAQKLPVYDFELLNPQWEGGSNAFKEWTLRIAADEQQTATLLDNLAKRFANEPVWPSSSKIGGQVADRMQNKALMAIFVSMIGIIIYIWVRFQHLTYGLAAVLATFHDVMITVGAIAVSTWLASALGFLLIEEFKINLTVVAALLTIIGYSINDTIVVFDRIREVRGKSPRLTFEMANQSVNQTLSRTLLTGSTTMIVLVVLYAFGGEGIHVFCFSLLVGCVVGTYSSVFIATPLVLWMSGEKGNAVTETRWRRHRRRVTRPSEQCAGRSRLFARPYNPNEVRQFFGSGPFRI